MRLLESENLRFKKLVADLFREGVKAVDPIAAISNSIALTGRTLAIAESNFDLDRYTEIYVVALGKAGGGMAIGIDQKIRDLITAAVISAPGSKQELSAVWRIFNGGHPIPNEESLAAARFAITLLSRANSDRSLVIFLISGGGSAMLELPRDNKISLRDIRSVNKLLVNCGASISEINTIRRRLSLVKGGGLALCAPRATQVSLIISDTNDGDEQIVASGPSFVPDQDDASSAEIAALIDKYKLRKSIPLHVLKSIEDHSQQDDLVDKPIEHASYTLLTNENALNTVVRSAEKLGFVTKKIDDLVEAPIDEGCRELVKRLLDLRDKVNDRPVCLVSGGEFACPVIGSGVGGRNLESALRTAILLDDLKSAFPKTAFTALFAGTDGIDGNSPAAGAICDQTTLQRARSIGMNAKDFLEKSDAYNFFSALGDTIETGPTGTNTRDIRILMAS